MSHKPYKGLVHLGLSGQTPHRMNVSQLLRQYPWFIFTSFPHEFFLQENTWCEKAFKLALSVERHPIHHDRTIKSHFQLKKKKKIQILCSQRTCLFQNSSRTCLVLTHVIRMLTVSSSVRVTYNI